MHRRSWLTAALLAPALFAPAAPAGATDFTPFDAAAFAAAQAEGKPILVDVWASWCPTCKAQQPTLAAIAADPTYRELVIFRVNFDTQKDAVAALGARMQSTLVVFRGREEKGRSVGDSKPDSIRALVARCTG